jgi:hypothetical protein
LLDFPDSPFFATSTTFAPATGLSTRTVTTTPDNFTQTNDSFLDGRTATVSGFHSGI